MLWLADQPEIPHYPVPFRARLAISRRSSVMLFLNMRELWDQPYSPLAFRGTGPALELLAFRGTGPAPELCPTTPSLTFDPALPPRGHFQASAEVRFPIFLGRQVASVSARGLGHWQPGRVWGEGWINSTWPAGNRLAAACWGVLSGALLSTPSLLAWDWGS